MKLFKYIILIICIFCSSLFAKTNILVLQDFYHLPKTNEFNLGLNDVQEKYNNSIVFYMEHMHKSLHTGDISDEDWKNFLLKKYKNVKIDAIISASPDSSIFLEKYERLFGNIPLVVINQKATSFSNPIMSFSANIRKAISETFKLALKQNPSTKKIILITNNQGVVLYKLFNLSKEEGIDFKVINVDSIKNIIKKVSTIDKETLLFYEPVFEDKFRVKIIPKELITIIAKYSSVPIYTFWTPLMNTGVIGGHMVDTRALSNQMVESIIYYKKNNFFPPKRTTLNTYLDWEAMEKFAIDFSSIPYNSKVLNKPKSIFQTYYKEISSAFVAVLLFLIFTIYSIFKLKKLNKKILDMNETIKNKNEQLSQTQHIAKIASWSYNLIKSKFTWSDEIYSIFELEKNSCDVSYESLLNQTHIDDRDIVIKAHNNFLETKNDYRIVYRLLMLDGRIKWLIEESKTELSIDDKYLKSTGVIQDITSQYEQERQLFESQKLAAMGEMIVNISHQWRQPLNTISIAASGMNVKHEMDLLEDKDIEEFSKLIIDNTEYLSKTIDTFRNFLKEEKIYKIVILQDRIKEALEIINTPLNDKNINFIDLIDYSNPIEINLIMGELTQVLINIINNSKEAIVEKKISDAWIKLSLEKLDNKVIIYVEDNGGGISEDILPHVFEPYFTTKHQYLGTGLGLHMSNEIIENHLGGKLDAKNTKEGAVFRIELPLNH